MVHIILFGIDYTLNNCLTGQYPHCPILKIKIMTHTVEVRITNEAFIDTNINDEYIYRELARKLVSDIRFEELIKLIEFIKIDPNDKDFRSKMHEYDINEVRRLKNKQLVLFRASIII